MMLLREKIMLNLDESYFKDKAESKIFYLSSEGLKLRVFYCRPKKKGYYPLVIVNHGGGGMGIIYEIFCMNLAVSGIASAVMTYRGFYPSEGLQEYGKGEIKDIENLIKFLTTELSIDHTSIGFLGLSRGGHHALLAATKVKVKAIAIWSSPTEPSKLYPIHRIMFNDIIGGSPEEMLNEYDIRSPVKMASQIKAPILVIHGERDSVVPISQAYLLINTLKHYNKEISFHVMKDEEHNFSIKSLLKAWDITINFFHAELYKCNLP